MNPQYFKGDTKELKFDAAGEPKLTSITTGRNDFFDGAYNCFALGDLLYDSGRAPFAKSIDRAVFRQAFSAIFQAFVEAGTFESYMTVFRNIFGDDVDVVFTVPAPGKLGISITSADLVDWNWVARSIVDNAYVFDQLVTESGDTLVFETIQGIDSDYELNQLIFEVVPGGIFTTITLDIGA